MTYDIDYVFSEYNAPNWIMMAGFFISFSAFVVYYVEGLRVGAKHKASGMPWQTNMWNMANDILFVAAVMKWLPGDSPTHNWVTVLQWVGMTGWFFMELAVHVQIIRWNLDEIFPRAKSRGRAIAAYVLTQAAFIVGYGFLHNSIGDPLVIIMITTTYFGCCVFNLAFLRMRGSRRGVSLLLPWSLVVAEVTWFFVFLPFVDPSWASSPWLYLAGIVCTGLSVSYLIAYRRAPAYVVRDEAMPEPVGAATA